MPLHTVLNLSSSLCWGLWAPRELNLRKEKKQRGQDPPPGHIILQTFMDMPAASCLSQGTCHSKLVIAAGRERETHTSKEATLC